MPTNPLRAWRLPVIGIAVFIGLYIGYWLVYAFDREAHAFWLGIPDKGGGEDKGVEWIGFAGFLFAGIISLFILRFRGKMHHRLVFLYILGVGLFYIVCAGEEISWGQRVFGWETSESFAAINEQDETNLHNIETLPFHPKDVVSWWMKLFGIGFPVIFYFVFKGKDHWLRWCVAPLSTVPLFIFVEVFNLLEEPFTPLSLEIFDRAARRLIINQHEELVEMYWGLCVLVAAVGMYRMWKKAPPSANQSPNGEGSIAVED